MAASSGGPAERDRGPLVAGPEVVPLEAVPFPMLMADGDGRVRSVNSRWVRASGLSREQAAGTGWLAALAPDQRPLVSQAVERIRHGGDHYRGRHRWAERPTLATWYMTSHRQAGDLLIGIAVTETDPGSGPPPDPYRAELRALLSSAESLAATLDRLLLRLPEPPQAG